MSEAVELGKLLYDTPDLFPWVCLAIVCIVAITHIQTVVNRIDETVTKNEKNLFVLKDRDNDKRR